jgi:hypothetical protein
MGSGPPAGKKAMYCLQETPNATLPADPTNSPPSVSLRVTLLLLLLPLRRICPHYPATRISLERQKSAYVSAVPAFSASRPLMLGLQLDSAIQPASGMIYKSGSLSARRAGHE